MGIDCAMHHGEAKTAATRLGGEEGVEQAVANVGGNARTTVRHADGHRAVGECNAGTDLFRRGRRDIQPDLSIRRRRLNGVEEQVEDRAVQQVLVALELIDVFRHIGDDGHTGLTVGMREREGKHLAKDLTARIRTMRQAVARVKKLAPLVQVRYRQTLLDRIRAAGLEAPQVDAERIQKEVIYFADRSDVSEELTRLDAHFAQYDTVAKSGEPVGRTLDFLAQEMNREINTLGAKANDSQISADVVMLKTELEKFREQVQNVE